MVQQQWDKQTEHFTALQGTFLHFTAHQEMYTTILYIKVVHYTKHCILLHWTVEGSMNGKKLNNGERNIFLNQHCVQK